MSKISDGIVENATGAQRGVRIAYTLNNSQPVRCTIIGDQPLFYMNFDGDMEDESSGFGDPFIMEEIEEGLASFEKNLNVSEYPAHESLPVFRILEMMGDTGRQITMPAEKERKAESTDDLVRILGKSRLGAAYLDFAVQHGARIVHSRQTGTADYDRRSGTITINPGLEKTDQLLLAASELRRLWQHRNGALVHPLTFHPDQAILVNRAQIADQAVNMIRIAWELQLAGEIGPWNRLECSPLADLCRAFAREAGLDFRSINNGSAGSAVFEAWFLSERCRHEDRILIQQMLADYHGHVFETAEPSRTVTAELIATLGSMPFGKNYLSPYVAAIMADPLFTEVRDRSNANFLWFIKFERSFRETEQELQTHESVRRRDIPYGIPEQKEHRRIGDDEKNENIIALPAGRAESRIFAAGNGISGGGSGNIIAFPHTFRDKR